MKGGFPIAAAAFLAASALSGPGSASSVRPPLATAALAPRPAPPAGPPLATAALAASVREEFLSSWKAYERFAWGHDELRPVSRTPRDWYGESLLMTPVDALDTLGLMGLRDE